jgi:hypothetical protein
MEGYQPTADIINDENRDLADPHSILSRWKNYLCQLLHYTWRLRCLADRNAYS